MKFQKNDTVKSFLTKKIYEVIDPNPEDNFIIVKDEYGDLMKLDERTLNFISRPVSPPVGKKVVRSIYDSSYKGDVIETYEDDSIYLIRSHKNNSLYLVSMDNYEEVPTYYYVNVYENDIVYTYKEKIKPNHDSTFLGKFIKTVRIGTDGSHEDV